MKEEKIIEYREILDFLLSVFSAELDQKDVIGWVETLENSCDSYCDRQGSVIFGSFHERKKRNNLFALLLGETPRKAKRANGPWDRSPQNSRFKPSDDETFVCIQDVKTQNPTIFWGTSGTPFVYGLSNEKLVKLSRENSFSCFDLQHLINGSKALKCTQQEAFDAFTANFTNLFEITNLDLNADNELGAKGRRSNER